MAKIGIVCDMHKVTRFKEQLALNGFKNLTVMAHGKNPLIQAIAVDIGDMDEKAEQEKIHKICKEIENYFKKKN